LESEALSLSASWSVAVTLTAVFSAAAANTILGSAGSHPDLSGAWTLNRDSSEFPREVGFDPNWLDGGSGSGGQSGTTRSGGGGRGGRGGGGGSARLPPPAGRYLSEEDSKKIQELVNEVKVPPAQLTISQTDLAVGIIDARGRRRVFHTNGKEDIVQLDAGPIGAITKWQGVELLIRYLVDNDQELRYWYSRDPTQVRLVVRVQFADHGRGETIRRVYETAPAGQLQSPPPS